MMYRCGRPGDRTKNIPYCPITLIPESAHKKHLQSLAKNIVSASRSVYCRYVHRIPCVGTRLTDERHPFINNGNDDRFEVGNAALSRQWIELDGWFYHARLYSLWGGEDVREDGRERYKIAGQSSRGSGMPWSSECTRFIEEKEGSLRRAWSFKALERWSIEVRVNGYWR